MALDVRRARRDVHPLAVRPLLLMREYVVAVRLEAELLELQRDDVLERALQLAGRRVHAVVAERGDADGPVVPAVRVTADHAVAALSTGPDVPELVDDVVVADVSPAARDRVVVVDAADRRRGVRSAVVGDGVMDDRLLDALVLRRPEHEVLVRGPILARADGRRAGGSGLGVRAAEIAERAAQIAREPRDRTRVEVAHVHERESDLLEGGAVASRQPHAVLREARGRHRIGTREPFVAVVIGHILVGREDRPLGPARAVTRGADLDVERVLAAERGDPVDAEVVEGLARVDRVGGEEERAAAGRARVLQAELGPALGAHGEAAGGPRGVVLHDLTGDDLARSALRGDRRGARAREQHEDEQGRQEHEAQSRMTSDQAVPLLPRHPPDAPPDSATGTGSCIRSNAPRSVVLPRGLCCP